MKTTLLTCALLAAGLSSLPAAESTPAAADAPPVIKPATSAPATGIGGGLMPAMPVPRASSTAAYSTKANRKTNTKESPAPLLVQFAKPDGEALDGLSEDLTIMARLIERSLERDAKEDGPVLKMGVPLLINNGSPSVRAMYLDGFGALFMIKVNFPLVGAVAANEEKPAAGATSDWESAKREVAETESIDKWSAKENESTGGEFDPARVALLQTAIFHNLKHASHIRHLKPDDLIAVTVFGTPAAEAPPALEGRAGGSKAARAAAQNPARSKETRAQLARSRKGTVMTIRVKKAEIDALASQQLTIEELKNRATINSYFAGGYATTSLNSWALTGSSRATSEARRDAEP